MINFIQSLILGLVEGFTEFLPISSTAHLIIASNLMRLAQTDYTKTFAIAIQSGAILAVVVLYWKRFLDWQVLKRIIIAFIPTGVLGLLFYKLVKNYLLGNMNVVLWALGLGGIFLIIFEYIFKSKGSHAAALLSEGTSTSFSISDDIKNINTGSLLGIGLFQAMAMIPGVSRAAATIIGGMILGIKRATIVEFSFLLAVPTMLAATSLDLYKSYREFSSAQFSLLAMGFIASFVMAILSIRFLLGYIKKHTFTGFGIYRVILVAAILLFGLIK